MPTDKLHDPFNPASGEFRKNIRLSITDIDDDELKKSLKQFGWNKEFPAITDENDVVLVGHRRLRLARQLEIEPVIKKITLGAGDEADAERLKLAIISNIGSAPMTRDDRKRIAEHLYGQRQWTMERIAEALNVSVGTVSGDLGGFSTSEKPSRPKGGRPKGSGGGGKKRKSKAAGSAETPAAENPAPRSSTRGRETPKLDRAREVVRAMLEANQPINPHALQEQHAISHVTFDMAITAELARREALAEPVINRDDLSLTAQQRFDIAVRQEKLRLAAEFKELVYNEVKRRMEEREIPALLKKIEAGRAIYARRGGLMTRDTYTTIIRALHPDSRGSISEGRMAEAFNAFKELEPYMLREQDSPTEWPSIPSTLAEWDRDRAAATAERKAKRTARTATTVKPR